jgi:hypothetical protein
MKLEELLISLLLVVGYSTHAYVVQPRAALIGGPRQRPWAATTATSLTAIEYKLSKMDDLSNRWADINSDHDSPANSNSNNNNAYVAPLPTASAAADTPLAPKSIADLASEWASRNKDNDQPKPVAVSNSPPPPPQPATTATLPPPAAAAAAASSASTVSMADLAKEWAMLNRDHDEKPKSSSPPAPPVPLAAAAAPSFSPPPPPRAAASKQQDSSLASLAVEWAAMNRDHDTKPVSAPPMMYSPPRPPPPPSSSTAASTTAQRSGKVVSDQPSLTLMAQQLHSVRDQINVVKQNMRSSSSSPATTRSNNNNRNKRRLTPGVVGGQMVPSSTGPRKNSNALAKIDPYRMHGVADGGVSSGTSGRSDICWDRRAGRKEGLLWTQPSP